MLLRLMVALVLQRADPKGGGNARRYARTERTNFVGKRDPEVSKRATAFVARPPGREALLQGRRIAAQAATRLHWSMGVEPSQLSRRTAYALCHRSRDFRSVGGVRQIIKVYRVISEGSVLAPRLKSPQRRLSQVSEALSESASVRQSQSTKKLTMRMRMRWLIGLANTFSETGKTCGPPWLRIVHTTNSARFG